MRKRSRLIGCWKAGDRSRVQSAAESLLTFNAEAVISQWSLSSEEHEWTSAGLSLWAQSEGSRKRKSCFWENGVIPPSQYEL